MLKKNKKVIKNKNPILTIFVIDTVSKQLLYIYIINSCLFYVNCFIDNKNLTLFKNPL